MRVSIQVVRMPSYKKGSGCSLMPELSTKYLNFATFMTNVFSHEPIHKTLDFYVIDISGPYCYILSCHKE